MGIAMKDCKISIIVPVYKVEKYIGACIESICAQTYNNLEILLVDDGSPDSCGGICDAYALRDQRIRVLHIANSGQSHARNVGMDAASGDYIGFVDGDDRTHPEMYERLLGLMLENGAAVGECNFNGRKKDPSDRMEKGTVICMSGREAIARQLDSRVPSRYPSTSVWSKLFRRDILDDLRLPDGRIHEEYAFLCEAFLRTDRYVYLNECLYERTLRDDSTTAEAFSQRSLDKVYVYRLRNAVLEQRNETALLAMSREQEYELLLHYAALAADQALDSEEETVIRLIREQKKDILRSGLPCGKKLQYVLLFINKRFYYRLRRRIRGS